MSDTSAPAYQRILLKLSGEALRSPGSMDNISPEIVARIAEEIAQAHRDGGLRRHARHGDERPGPPKRAGTRGSPLRGAVRH